MDQAIAKSSSRRARARRLAWIAIVAGAAALPVRGASDAFAPQDDPAARERIEVALRRFFAADRPQGAPMEEVLAAAKGSEDLLARIITSKSFVAPGGPVSRRGVIDDKERFKELVEPTDSAPAKKAREAENAALFFGPAAAAALCPLIVFVPDSTTTAGWEAALARDGVAQGRFVFLVPDEKQDNRWNPTRREERRHVGPLRDFLLAYAIDPDRVVMIGTGRGGHATWDVGLLYADRFAGIFPCNGGLIHEGGYKASGGVFLENAKSLDVRTVYNTTFDHGIEGCRYAVRKFKEWGYRIEAVEEQKFRHMGIAEAMEKLGGATRTAHPREIVKRFNHLEAGDHFWLEALDRVPDAWNPSARITLRGPLPVEPEKQRERIWEHVKTKCALLKGTIEGDRIIVTTHGVGRVRVWFDPELVDYRNKLTVTIDGKMRVLGPLQRRADVMLKRVHETGDTARLYWAFRDFAVNGRD